MAGHHRYHWLWTESDRKCQASVGITGHATTDCQLDGDWPLITDPCQQQTPNQSLINVFPS